MDLDVNTKTKIGNIVLEYPFINASGCWCTQESELKQLVEANVGAVITKTITLNPRTGNPKPRYYDNNYLSVNSMGLPNMGYGYYKHFVMNYHNDAKQNNSNINKNKPILFSLSTMNLNDTFNILDDIDDNLIQYLSGIEFNISCPNIEGKGQMGYDYDQLNDFLTRLNRHPIFDESRNNLAIGLKMSPYFERYQFESVASILNNYPRLDFLTCINGVGNGLVVDFFNEKSIISPNGGLGGLGGSIVKPIGLSNTLQFKRLIGNKLDIIGCGGISTGIDAFEYLLSGSSCLAVGTQLMKNGPDIFNRLNNELVNVMSSKKYSSINQFKNKIV